MRRVRRPNTPGAKFCGECGAALAASAPTPAPTPAPAPEAERRLVSVFFADLVGFTALSEDRDPEEVRELLSRYFDTARRVIGRYGGTVEKFIGDAVMAVWGAPVAREDDAERAVRAALELVDAVRALGEEAGTPDLCARAGVTAGEAAVTVGAEGQGMVAGDLVNTASRVQTAAQPGSVLRRRGDATDVRGGGRVRGRRGARAQGKAEPVRLWRALRVVAATGGAQRSSALEPPFTGRNRELRMVKELFHASADDRRAQLISVVGGAGIGKSRLVWEFFKYLDGLAIDTRWHRGRCLAYGEGVTYWALAEMVRTNASILEGEDPDTALPKLLEAVEIALPDPEERRWVEPRLASLLGLETGPAREREDLFAAWRLFYERLAEVMPTVMVFEDIHWADTSLLDFVEYLLEWSRNSPLFILTLARPELLERRPDWGSGRRASTSVYLEPLTGDSMITLLEGLGLPDTLADQVRDRAEGVPLYAVETVRMLVDRGVLTPDDAGYRATGPVDELDVPETLHGLIAARLDGLSPDERRLVQDAAVLGKTFTKEALGAVATIDDELLDQLLAALVRKEILTVQADPLSPERGQYAFLGDLVRFVAYETLSKKERKTRHLAVADYLEAAFDEDDVVEVVASHYLEAVRAAPDAEDAAAIRAKACDRLTRAGERAASLAAHEDAYSRYEEAAGLADGPSTRALLLERAGEAARATGRLSAAAADFEQAADLFESAGETHPAARATARLGGILYEQGRIDDGIERMEQAFGVLSIDEPDGDLAALAHELARLYLFTGNARLHYERVELALDIAEALELPAIVAEALNTKSVLYQERPHESGALMREALRIALDHDLTSPALRAYNNLAYLLGLHDHFDEARAVCADGIALARRRGYRNWEWILETNLVEALFHTGEWDRAIEITNALPEGARQIGFGAFPAEVVFWIYQYRNELEPAREMAALTASAEDSNDLQVRGIALLVQARLSAAEGRHDDAVRFARAALEPLVTYGSPYLNEGVGALVDTALAAGEVGILEEGLSRTDGVLPTKPTLRAHRARASALLAARAGASDRVEPAFKAAEASFDVARTPFWLAVTRLDHAEWLVGEGRAPEAEPLLAEARETFERLKAVPWLERAESLPLAEATVP